MVPTIAFTEYLVQKLRPIIELGVEWVHLEEPEFWSRAGYSPSFRREWRAYYGEDWQPPHESPEAHFRAGQLKQHLLVRCLDRVTTSLRDEALRTGRELRFSIPTHSLLNYTQWQIVSPESRLRDLPSIHGAIAQVWTGTSRTPNVYAGIPAERTFETAYLEYGIAQDLTRGTDRSLWFLHDPIEDHPDRTWQDYLANYHRTLVASLLHPGVSRYEVAPWPHRIFTGSYPSDQDDHRVTIPPATATSYLITMNSLRDLEGREVSGAPSGPRIGVLLSDTAMFERWRPGETTGHYDGLQDALAVEGRDLLHFSDFYGLALPLLFDGQQVRPVQLENMITSPGALDDLDLLILSYEFQKPLTPALHYALAGWIAGGGGLVYVGDGTDPYHRIRQWWTGRYRTPAHHLAEAVGLAGDVVDHGSSVVSVGEGAVSFVAGHPAGFTESAESAAQFVDRVSAVARATGRSWASRGWLSVRRGPYLIGAVPSDGIVSKEGVPIDGIYVDLLRPELPIVRHRDLQPGDVVWLRDIEHDQDVLLASAGRIVGLHRSTDRISYRCETPAGVEAVTALRVTAPPRQVTGGQWRHDQDAGVLWVRHPGDPTGVLVEVMLG
jgi:hypothetical protein